MCEANNVNSYISIICEFKANHQYKSSGKNIFKWRRYSFLLFIIGFCEINEKECFMAVGDFFRKIKVFSESIIYYMNI